MSYWDTSTLVKLYAQEPDSPVFEAHAASQISPPLTSRIALYEARATFHRKEAEGVLAAGTAQITYNELLQDVATKVARTAAMLSHLSIHIRRAALQLFNLGHLTVGAPLLFGPATRSFDCSW